jgi:hypothetical protein
MTFLAITDNALVFGMTEYQAIMGLLGSVFLFALCSYYDPLEYNSKRFRMVNLLGMIFFGIGMILMAIFKEDLF